MNIIFLEFCILYFSWLRWPGRSVFCLIKQHCWVLNELIFSFYKGFDTNLSFPLSFVHPCCLATMEKPDRNVCKQHILCRLCSGLCLHTPSASEVYVCLWSPYQSHTANHQRWYWSLPTKVTDWWAFFVAVHFRKALVQFVTDLRVPHCILVLNRSLLKYCGYYGFCSWHTFAYS